MNNNKNISDINSLVSVIIPLFNGSKYIEATISSVLSQSYQSLEILVVDDGSLDDGLVKVSKLGEQYPNKIKLLHHPDNGNHGVAASRNVAIRNASGYYIAFIDQDDIWLPYKLEKQINILQQFPEASLVYAKVRYIDEEGEEKKIHNKRVTYGKGVPGHPKHVFARLIQEDFIPNLTVVVKKSCIERVGLLDEGPKYEYEDWLLLSKLAFFYKFLFIPEVMAEWREHGNNFSSKIFSTGRYRDAEEHCTIALFSFLIANANITLKDIRGYLHRRIWRLFFRSRSWGASKKDLEKHMINLIKAFPAERWAIKIAFSSAVIMHPRIALILRRIRRNIIGT